MMAEKKNDWQRKLDEDEVRKALHHEPRPKFLAKHPWCVWFGAEFGGRYSTKECAARTAIGGSLEHVMGIVINDQTEETLNWEDCFRLIHERERNRQNNIGRL